MQWSSVYQPYWQSDQYKRYLDAKRMAAVEVHHLVKSLPGSFPQDVTEQTIIQWIAQVTKYRLYGGRKPPIITLLETQRELHEETIALSKRRKR